MFKEKRINNETFFTYMTVRRVNIKTSKALLSCGQNEIHSLEKRPNPHLHKTAGSHCRYYVITKNSQDKGKIKSMRGR